MLSSASAAAAISISPGSLPDGAVGVSYSQTLTASGGSAPYTISYDGGQPVPGLLLIGGVLSGTPTAAGTYTFNVRAVDAALVVGQMTYTIVVTTPTITLMPATLPRGTAGTPYSQSLSAVGGVAPYSYTLASGSLPAGMTLTSAGAITGTPTQAGSYNVSIDVSDGNGATGARSYSIDIDPALTIAPASGELPWASTTRAYSQTFTASGGTGPHSFAVVGGALPAGMTFTSAGVLSGTPTAAGSFTFAVRASDSTPGTPLTSAATSYTLKVAAYAVDIAPGSLPGGAVGVSYSQTLTASGGSAPYTISYDGGQPVPGLLLIGGVLSGTPTTAGTYTFKVRAVDAALVVGQKTYTIVVTTPTITVMPATLPRGTAGTPYSQSLSAVGGVAPYSYSLASGSLPAGMTLTSAGAITGTPTQAGSYNVSIDVSDANGATGARSYSIQIDPALTIAPASGELPWASTTRSYSQTFTASGGTGPHSFAVVGGALPAGMTFTSAGVLSGTPATAGSFTFTVRASDSTPGTPLTSAATNYTLKVAAYAVDIAPGSLPGGAAGVAYSQTLTASGGSAPYTITYDGGQPVPGLLLIGGVLSGTPTAAGSYTFKVRAVDAALVVGQMTYTVQIAGPLNIASPTAGALPPAAPNMAYNQTFVAGGGVAPYTWAVSSGSLPAGVTLNSSGALAGTPIESGSFSFTVTATDGAHASTSATYSLTVAATPIAVDDNASTRAGQPVAIAVTQNDTGDISAVNITGMPAHGTVAVTGLIAAYTPASGFVGTDSFTYTSTGAGGTSAAATVTVVVEGRPDPTLDPDVSGLVNAQVAATLRFARAQIGNFSQRLQSLHGAQAAGGGNAFNLRIGSSSPATSLAACSADAGGPMKRPRDLCRSTVADDTAVAAPAQAPREWSLWTGGYVNFGDRDATASQSGFEFNTEGVSVGADKPIGDRLIAGIGVGYGRDDSDIGDAGSRSRSEGWTLAAYGSLEPFEGAYLDGVVGLGSLDFTSRRDLAGDLVAQGQRSGDQRFASLAFGIDRRSAGWHLSPYMALAWGSADLDEFTERSGDPDSALRFGKQSVDMLTSSLGVRVERESEQSWGTIAPYLRGEWLHDFQDAGTASLSYANWTGGPTYRLQTEEGDSGYGRLGLGLAGRRSGGLFFELGYEVLVGFLNDRDQSVLMRVGAEF